MLGRLPLYILFHFLSVAQLRIDLDLTELENMTISGYSPSIYNPLGYLQRLTFKHRCQMAFN